jgi:hypothetical protein
LNDLFSASTLFKLNFLGIQHLEYIDIREMKPPVNPCKTPDPSEGSGFVEGHKILTLTLTPPDPYP